MRHLESSFSGRNGFWRYLVMIGAIFLATNTVGAIPLLAGMIIQALKDPDAITGMASDPANFNLPAIDINLQLFMLLFPFLVGLIAYILLIKPLHNKGFVQTLNGTGRIRWNRVLVSASVWIVISVIYLVAYLRLDPGNFIINNTSSSLVFLVLVSIIFIPFQSGFEEVLFRGYLMQGFAVLFRNRFLPVVVTSVLFGLMHAWNPEIRAHGFFTMMPQYILSGLLFGVITVLDDGIEIAAGAHIANNLFLSVMVTNSSSTLRTAAVYEQLEIEPRIEFWALLAASVIFFVIMKLIYRWRDTGILWRKVEPFLETQTP